MLDLVLGDFAALGYDPVTPIEKVTALSHATFTRGNTDRYVVTGSSSAAGESTGRPRFAATGHRGGKKLLLDQGLSQRREVDVAHTLARLLQSGYIKPIE